MEDHDVNTPDGFAASMRAAEQRSGVEEEDAGAEPVLEEPSPVDDSPPQDDRVARLEQELRDAQQMIGRQSNEIGALRQEQDQWAQDEAQETAMVTAETWEQISETYESKGGIGLMAQVSHQQPQMIDAALSFWKAQGDPEAFLYERQMQDIEAAIADQQAAQAGPDPELAEVRLERAQEKAVDAVRRELGNERVAAAEPLLREAMQDAPSTLQRALDEDFRSGDVERTASAFKTLISLAETRDPEMSRLAADQRAAAQRQAKLAAAPHTGSRRAAAGESDLPATPEEMAALDPETRRATAAKIMGDRILGNQTSVAAELAKSQQQ